MYDSKEGFSRAIGQDAGLDRLVVLTQHKFLQQNLDCHLSNAMFQVSNCVLHDLE